MPRESRATLLDRPSANACEEDPEPDIFCQNSDVPIRDLQTSNDQNMRQNRQDDIESALEPQRSHGKAGTGKVNLLNLLRKVYISRYGSPSYYG